MQATGYEQYTDEELLTMTLTTPLSPLELEFSTRLQRALDEVELLTQEQPALFTSEVASDAGG